MENRRLQQVYDRIAAEYSVRNREMPPTFLKYGRLVMAMLPEGAHVLDVGCGAGRDMAWLGEHGVHVTGIDLSWGMLQKARTRARGGLVQMDMRALAFSDRLFEGVWCTAALLHLPKADAPVALREMRRVLRDGCPMYLDLLEGAGEGWATSGYGSFERYFARYTLDEVERLLISTGFEVRCSERGESQGRNWLEFLLVAGESS